MDRDTVLAALEALSEDQGAPLPNQLEEYLRAVARSGDPLLPWSNVKPLYQRKLALVLDEFMENPECNTPDKFDAASMRTRLLQRLDSFDTCPFTLQRLSELLTMPREQYSRTDKFMRAIEKNVLVVSGNDPPHITANGLTEDNGHEAPEPKKIRLDEVETETPVTEQNGVHHEDKKDEEQPASGPEGDGEMKDVEEPSKMEEPAQAEPIEPEADSGPESAEPEKEGVEVTEAPKEPEEQPTAPVEPETPQAEPVEVAEKQEEPVVSEDQEMPLVEKEAPLASPEKDFTDEKCSKALESESVPMEEQS